MSFQRNVGFKYMEKIWYNDGELDCIQYCNEADFNIILIEFQRPRYMTKGLRANISVQVDGFHEYGLGSGLGHFKGFSRLF